MNNKSVPIEPYLIVQPENSRLEPRPNGAEPPDMGGFTSIPVFELSDYLVEWMPVFLWSVDSRDVECRECPLVKQHPSEYVERLHVKLHACSQFGLSSHRLLDF